MKNNESYKTVVVGASPNPTRYSYMAVRDLSLNDVPLVALGIREGKIAEHDIILDWGKYDDIHTVTLYIGPKRQEQYYDYILSMNPRRIIFNPDTENDEFVKLAEAQGIECIEACTLVMLRTKKFLEG